MMVVALMMMMMRHAGSSFTCVSISHLLKPNWHACSHSSTTYSNPYLILSLSLFLSVHTEIEIEVERERVKE